MLVLATWAGVGCSPPPGPPGLPPPAETARPISSGTHAGAPPAPLTRCPGPYAGPDEVFGGPWVKFLCPPYLEDVGSGLGPQWEFRPIQIPALSTSGEQLLLHREDESLGALPGMDLDVVRVEDGRLVSSIPLLDIEAFVGAHRSSLDSTARRQAYGALGAKTIEAVDRVNASLTMEGWQPLEACRIDIDASATQPPCSMREQQIQCGRSTRLVYHEPRLDITVGGRRQTVSKPRWAGRSVRALGGGPPIPVRGCVQSAHFSPTAGIVVLRLVYACHGAGGGDWCHAPSSWETVRLPVAPGPDPSATSAAGSCPQGMSTVPAGSFAMGSADGRADELPVHAVQVAAFCIDKTEVSVSNYRACLNAGRCFAPKATTLVGPGSWLADTRDASACHWGVAGREHHPINCAPLSFAQEYCDWAGKRLPTEEEWEYAARGAGNAAYPWGPVPPVQGVCFRQSTGGGCRVGSGTEDRSPFGVMDMGGNVSEWTASLYAFYDGCGQQDGYVLRGGSWGATDAGDLRATRREMAQPSARSANLGFRCARSLTRSP